MGVDCCWGDVVVAVGYAYVFDDVVLVHDVAAVWWYGDFFPVVVVSEAFEVAGDFFFCEF